MLVDVYDLSGLLCCSRYRVDETTCSFELLKRKRISDVLICPDIFKCRNQPPYIQNRYSPFIRDILDDSGRFQYKNCSLLGDFFQMEHQDDFKLESFFKSLQASPYVFTKPADKNVILIPDNYDAQFQEKILRACCLPRESTFLLWRSVAACLGNLSFVKKEASGDYNITIVDVQQRYIDVCRLNVVEDSGVYVPQRKAYKKGSSYYPIHESYDGVYRYTPNNNFYRYTYYGRQNECVVWNEKIEQFEINVFERLPKPPILINNISKSDVLMIGAKPNLMEPAGRKFLVDSKGSSLSDGAALYIARKLSGLPTYFDECTGLYIVVQDLDKEVIFAKELIPPNEKCRGGEEICGSVNSDCFIDKGADNVRFRLCEEKGDDVHLKVLDYRFKIGCMKKREPLTLYPSMIPGQGIARVRVKGDTQLLDFVELDLLKMELTNPRETVASLRAEIKHSYPIDIPAISASSQLWEKVAPDVNLYLKNNRFRNKKLFNLCRYAVPGATGIERLNRINVFGFAENHELPLIANNFNFTGLFKYMADDYRLCMRQNNYDDAYTVLSMISRTYQGNSPIFAFIKKEILSQVCSCSRGEIRSVSRHVMTACANLLREKRELETYFRAYLKKVEDVDSSYSLKGLIKELKNPWLFNHGRVPDLKGMMDWNRVFSELMIANSDMLRTIPTEECERCMKCLMIMLISHYHHKKYRLAYSVLKVSLFLLMRRKYDKSFLCQGRIVREYTIEVLSIVKESVDYTVSVWSNIVLKYIEGRGTLEDLIAVVDESNDNDE